MASVNKNALIPGQAVVASLVTRIPRGRNTNLGTIASSGDVVEFTVPEPSRDNQGSMIIAVGPGLVGATFALEVSLDNATSWAVAVGTQLALTGQPGGDTPAGFMSQYNVSGFGASAQFRFGLTAVTSGSAAVWVLCG